MPQPKKAARFGGTPAHHNLILSNLATELIRHGRIRTTAAKAKTVQPLAERMITFAKRGDVHSRRQVLKVIRDKDVVHKLFADVGPAFADRDGGYTRVLKLGPRKGDAAPMALIELVEGISLDGEDGALDEAPRRRWSLRRRKGGTQSTTARERAEERMAAVDRGEDVDDLEYLDDLDDAEAVPAGALQDEADGPVDELDADAAVDTDAEAPQVTPEQVEARFAAADEGEDDDSPTAPVPSEEQDAPEPERVPDETPETPTEDAPEGGEDAKP